MSNSPNTKFDPSLDQIDHLNRFPKMKPFVGENYEASSHKRLLIIGESGYFPDDSTIHKVPEEWYRQEQESLTEEESVYLDWRALLTGEWNQNGHEMYREINRCMKEVIDTSEDRAVSHIAYTNAFYRPASEPGESIKHCCTAIDFEKSIEISSSVIRCLKPQLVVFVSKFTWDSVGWRIAQANPSIKMDFTAHASDRRWFYRKGYPHAKPKLISLLNEHYINKPSLA